MCCLNSCRQNCLLLIFCLSDGISATRGIIEHFVEHYAVLYHGEAPLFGLSQAWNIDSQGEEAKAILKGNLPRQHSFNEIREASFVYSKDQKRTGYYFIVLRQGTKWVNALIWSSFNSYVVWTNERKNM